MTLSKRIRRQLFVRTVSGALSFALASPALAAPFVSREPAQSRPESARVRDEAYRKELATYALSVRQANQLINGFALDESRGATNWNQRRGQEGGPNEDWDMITGASQFQIRPPSVEEMREAAETQELVLQYYGHQGLNRFMGSFIESGSPYADGYQWDTQRWAGIKIPSMVAKLFDHSVQNNLLNIRVGVNVHDIDINQPATFQPTVDICREAWSRGISPTLSMLFFSSLKQWETRNADGSIDPSRSYLNHPNFARDAGLIAEKVLTAVWRAADEFNAANEKLPIETPENKDKPFPKRKPFARVAVNPVNEPETFAGFQHFWHGAFAKWNDPNQMKLYVPSTINIAKANVLIRMAAEKASGGRRTLFFHNEAMTPKDYPSHKGDGQFAVSKFMLGDADLMTANFDGLKNESLDSIQQRFDANKRNGHTNVVEWAILSSANIPENTTLQMRQSAQQKTVELLRELQHLHQAYTKMTTKYENGKVVKAGKTAKSDTIIMLDYYQQSEFILPKPVPEMIQELSANQGELLKKILSVQEDSVFMQILEERARQAEKATGVPLWQNYQSRQDIDFVSFLKQEDGVILDKLIGLRNEWELIKDPEFVERRQRAGLDEGLIKFNASDEKRDDGFLNELIANDSALLKKSLQISSDVELRKALLETAQSIEISVSDKASVREILNAGERSVLHNLFGLKRFRRTGFLPPHYARQTRAQMRKGLYETYLTYINELGIRIGGIGESGTPYYPWAAMVHKQMMLAAIAAARRAHMYFVRYDLGPLVGTIGWMNGPLIGSIKTNGKRASDGVMKLVRIAANKFDYALSFWPGQHPWFETFKNELLGGLGRQQARIAEQKARLEEEAKKTDVIRLAEQVQKQQVQRRAAVACAKVQSAAGH